MSDMYNVSVVIPVHNAMQTVKRAIDSAFKGGAAEVIVVDDGATDGTWMLLQALTDTYGHERYKLLSTGGVFPAGVCHARNYGIAHARYEAIIPLDADDYFVPDGISVLCKGLERSSLEQCVVYGARYVDGKTEVEQAPPPGMLNRKNLTGATYLFSTRLWQAAGGYHPDFNLGCEDWALMCALVSAGAQLVQVHEPAYVYTSGGQRGARCIRYADALWALLRAHYPKVFDAQPSR